MGGVARDGRGGGTPPSTPWPALPEEEEEERVGGGGRVEGEERAQFFSSSWTSAGMPSASFPFIACSNKKWEGRRSGKGGRERKVKNSFFRACFLLGLDSLSTKKYACKDPERDVGNLPLRPFVMMMVVVVVVVVAPLGLPAGQMKEEKEEEEIELGRHQCTWTLPPHRLNCSAPSYLAPCCYCGGCYYCCCSCGGYPPPAAAPSAAAKGPSRINLESTTQSQTAGGCGLCPNTVAGILPCHVSMGLWRSSSSVSSPFASSPFVPEPNRPPYGRPVFSFKMCGELEESENT